MRKIVLDTNCSVRIEADSRTRIIFFEHEFHSKFAEECDAVE